MHIQKSTKPCLHVPQKHLSVQYIYSCNLWSLNAHKKDPLLWAPWPHIHVVNFIFMWKYDIIEEFN